MIKIIKHPLAKKVAAGIVIGLAIKLISYQIEKRTSGVLDDD